MSALPRKGAEEARNQLPDLLDAAEKGNSTIITRHGRAVAALVPMEAYGAAQRQELCCRLPGPAAAYGEKTALKVSANCVTNGTVSFRRSA